MTINYDFSPQTVTQQAESLLFRLYAITAERQEYLYLLIDREALPQNVMHPFIGALVDQRPVPVMLPHRKLKMDSHPWLIKLDLRDSTHNALLVNSVFHALEEQHPDRLCSGASRAVCGWLTSPYETSVVAKQLGHTAIQRLVSGRKILLRYYDPVIHGILWPQLDDRQYKRWLGVLSGWHYPDGDGQLVSHCHTPPAYAFSTFSLMLAPEDEPGIYQAGNIGHLLERYRQAHISQPRHDETTAVTIIREALSRAIQLHGFQDKASQNALTLDCLRLHPQLDMHPRLKILLSPREREPGTDYAACVSTLTDSNWQQLCHDMNTDTAADGRSHE